jgi:hypothetical protein
MRMVQVHGFIQQAVNARAQSFRYENEISWSILINDALEHFIAYHRGEAQTAFVGAPSPIPKAESESHLP